MIVKIQVRRGLSTQWTSVNPILSSGEFGYETDTGKLKIGNGTIAWVDLEYTLNPEVIQQLVLQAEASATNAGISEANAYQFSVNAEESAGIAVNAIITQNGGAINTSSTPIVDSINRNYYPSISGTYTNFSGIIVDVTAGLNIIIGSSLNGFTKVLIPVDLVAYMQKADNLSTEIVSNNIYDKNTVVQNFLKNASGSVLPNAIYGYSQPIKVDSSTTYSMYSNIIATGARYVTELDINQAVLTGGSNTAKSSFTTGVNTEYLVLTVIKTAQPDFMVVQGISQPYDDYETRVFLKDTIGVKKESLDIDEVLVFLPEHIYVAVGRTIEIYNSQAVWTGNINDYHFLWSGIGKSMKRKWSLTGTTIANNTLTLSVFDNNMNLIASAVTTVHVVSSTISTPFSLCAIGDSLTNGKAWQPELITLSAGQISYQGTRGTIQTGTTRTHEGRSGVNASYYLGNNSYIFDSAGETGLDGRAQNLNPFWNPNTSQFDFNYYKSNYNKNPSRVMIWLGTNSITLDPTTNANNIKSIVDKIRLSDATIKIYICFTLFKSDQNGIGKETGLDGFVANTAWKLQEDRKVFNLQVRVFYLLKNYTNLHFIPISLCHDSEFNFGSVSTPVNPRASQVEYLPVEATHPQNQGYLQIADIMFSVLAGT